MESLKADFEFVKKPVDTVKNTFKKFMGKDIREDGEPVAKERPSLSSIAERFKSNDSNENSGNKSVSDWLTSYVKSFRRQSTSDKKDDEAIILSADEVKDKTEV